MFDQIKNTIQSALDQGQHWYATLDASQIPASQQATWESQRATWRNLLEGTPEGDQVDLTAWLLPLTQSNLEFTLNLSATYPHALTWLSSEWSINEIAAYWGALSDISLPHGRTGLCRFYDPCVLIQLEAVLSKPQWQRLLAPITQWMYYDPFGHIKNLKSAPSQLKSKPTLSLNQQQLDLLKQSNRPHWLLAQLMANEYVPFERNNFALFARVHNSVQLLQQCGLNAAEQQYIFCALTMDWSPTTSSSPRLAEHLSLAAKGKVDLIEAINMEITAHE